MPVRGSGIGASSLGMYATARGGGSGGTGGSRPAPAPQLLSAGSGYGYGAVTPWLLALVGIEVLALVYLRHSFRSYHGG